MKKSSLLLMDEYYLKFIITGLLSEYKIVDELYICFKSDKKILTRHTLSFLSDIQKKIKKLSKILDNLVCFNKQHDNEANVQYLRRCLSLLHDVSDTNKLFINYIRDKETDNYFNRNNLDNLLNKIEEHETLFNLDIIYRKYYG